MSDFDPHDLDAQQQSKAEKQRRQKLEREQERADLKWLMSSERGRRIIWRLMSQSGVFLGSFNENPAVMAFNEGRRAFGNRTLALVNTHAHEHYDAMVKENNDDRRNDD